MTLSSQFADAQFCNEVVDKMAEPAEGSGEPSVTMVIRDMLPATHTPIQRSSIHSSIGRLDRLPAELLSMVVGHLDFQSLSRLSRTSLLARHIVEQLPAYSDMMAHAPETLTALGKTRLLRYHAANHLQRVLRSDECHDCGKYFGAYLFLPTCERLCHSCLPFNCVTTTALAKRCFHLTERQLQTLPIMYSIPNTYDVGRERSRLTVYRLVSVRQAKKLAIEVHGSADAVQAFKPAAPHNSNHSFPRIMWTMQQYHDLPLEETDRNPIQEGVLDDEFGGMATIRFPTLTDGGPDYGTLCRGCRVTYDEYQDSELPDRVLQELSQACIQHDELGRSFILDENVFEAIIRRLWSKRRFYQHVKECYGVARLLGSGNVEE